MYEFLSRFNPGEMIAFVSICGGMVIGLPVICAGIWHKVRSEEISAALKRDMLDRGMTAEEIKMVLDAGPKT